MRNKKNVTSLLYPILFLLMLSFCYATGYSQTASTCILKGTVKDWSGALVPNAVITVSSKEIIRKSTASEFGEYSLSMPPGIYKVTVDAPRGFDTTYRSDIKLDPNTTKWLNLRVYFKFIVLGEPPEPSEHPIVDHVSYSYEEVPNFSDTGVRSGMIRFTEKCQSKTLWTYNGRAINDPQTLDARVTFSYDFFSVIADELRMSPNGKEIYALGNMEIENENEFVKYSGVGRIRMKDTKVTFDKIGK